MPPYGYCPTCKGGGVDRTNPGRAREGCDQPRLRESESGAPAGYPRHKPLESSSFIVRQLSLEMLLQLGSHSRHSRWRMRNPDMS